ncbi:UDP-N-acetylglucosamine 2-epimerase, partial [bacterium]|nr:UDP-N-acetylglucosamine 2-epimerase [bacterium]
MARIVTTVVGARPQFVKCSLLSRELRRRGIDERLVHTGQHYNPELSEIFIRELEIPEPDVNLGIGSDTHARQTARMMMELEAEFDSHRPEAVIVFGDTNSTLAAALVAVKMHLPLAHVEAGMRGYNKRLPEEHNRIVTDHLADLLVCHNERAAERLRGERVGGRIEICGDT